VSHVRTKRTWRDVRLDNESVRSEADMARTALSHNVDSEKCALSRRLSKPPEFGAFSRVPNILISAPRQCPLKVKSGPFARPSANSRYLRTADIAECGNPAVPRSRPLLRKPLLDPFICFQPDRIPAIGSVPSFRTAVVYCVIFARQQSPKPAQARDRVLTPIVARRAAISPGGKCGLALVGA
jgi:hypothetical protein